MIIKKIEDNLASIRGVLESEALLIDPNDIIDKIAELAAISALAADTLAEASALYNQRKAQNIRELKGEDLGPSVIIKLAEAEASEELKLKIRAERYQASITHITDGLRSSLSWHKQERELSRYQKS